MSDEELREGKNDLLEPLTAYKMQYERAFERNCEEYFGGLLEKSGVNLEQNRKTVAKYNAECKLKDEAGRRLSEFKALKWVCIFLIAVGAVLLFTGISLLVEENTVAGGVLIGIGPILILLVSFLLPFHIIPHIKKSDAEQKKHGEKAEEFLREAWRQTAPLNGLFENNVTKKLIEKTVPLIELDDYFGMRRYDCLRGKYGYGGNADLNASTIGILTGEIAGNPFAFDRVLVHTMGSETYCGSLVIHWETVERNEQGQMVTEHHSETLTASIIRPKPFYSKTTRLVYGNEAAPALHFSRKPSHVEDLDEKERAGRVKRIVGKIRKKQKKAMEEGKSFTEMGNEEFDALFGALDRDNDVEFRLLFTPLAQKNLLALITDGTGFGDDFYMRKDGCLNYITSEHSAQWDMDEKRERYFSYSVDLARKCFMNFNTQYFRSLYFDFAPLLSIPLYQQHKPHEYIYHESYPRYFTAQETEYVVNAMQPAAFAPRGAATPSILKTTFLNKDGESDRVRVTASAYREVPRVEFVSVSGGDGNMHDVPVDWIEYVPVSAETDVELKEIGLSDREFAREASEGKFAQAISEHGKYAYGYSHGILCCVVPEADSGFDRDFGTENKK